MPSWRSRIRRGLLSSDVLAPRSGRVVHHSENPEPASLLGQGEALASLRRDERQQHRRRGMLGSGAGTTLALSRHGKPAVAGVTNSMRKLSALVLAILGLGLALGLFS